MKLFVHVMGMSCSQQMAAVAHIAMASPTTVLTTASASDAIRGLTHQHGLRRIEQFLWRDDSRHFDASSSSADTSPSKSSLGPSSATDTQRQITIAKSAKSICACRVYGDIGALESGCAVGSFDTLAAPRPAMRPDRAASTAACTLACGKDTTAPALSLA